MLVQGRTQMNGDVVFYRSRYLTWRHRMNSGEICAKRSYLHTYM